MFARFPLRNVVRALRTSSEEIREMQQAGKARRCSVVGRYMTERGIPSPTIAQGLGERFPGAVLGVSR